MFLLVLQIFHLKFWYTVYNMHQVANSSIVFRLLLVTFLVYSYGEYCFLHSSGISPIKQILLKTVVSQEMSLLRIYEVQNSMRIRKTN